ncbi:MAG: glycosyltransferase, partial [Chloroflexi bacterium]
QDHDLFAEFQYIKEQGPYSSSLLKFVEASYDYFDIFIFITYLFATTRFGLTLVPGKAILVPTAHDEPFMYLPIFRSLFHLPQAIVYSTLPEKLLVNRITDNEKQIEEAIIGIGINVPEDVSASRFREKFKIEGDFVLYVGRIVQAKNVPELLDYFLRFRETYGKPIKLLLGGKSHLNLPVHPDIVHLGFLTEEEKFDAIHAARLVILPSLYESLSMIVLEAWLMKTAVLVNGRCEVLKYQCRKSNGGLYYTSHQEFEAALTLLLNSPDLCQQLGEQGHQFASYHYNWDTIITKYQTLFAKILSDEN